VISVDWGRRARDRMVAAGAEVMYHESAVPHTVDPAVIPILAAWLGEVI
jgi:predicted esterase